jgi:hypothetical protein
LERQHDLLRRVAAGEAVNESPDWPNIIEEIERGDAQRFAVERVLMQALIHMLRAEAWPLSRDVPHWQADVRVFRRQTRRGFTPSRRQRLDLADIYQDALHGLPDTIDGQLPTPVPTVCPVTLDELLAD